MVTEIMNPDTFIQKMKTEFQELATHETEGNPEADLAPKIGQISNDIRGSGEAGQRTKIAVIEHIRQLAKNAQKLEDRRDL